MVKPLTTQVSVCVLILLQLGAIAGCATSAPSPSARANRRLAEADKAWDHDEVPDLEHSGAYFRRIYPYANLPKGAKQKMFDAFGRFAKASGGERGGRWTSLGPLNIGGRVTDIAVVPQKPSQIYVASAEAGVWRTEDGGQTFRPIFEGYGTLSVGALGVDPNDPNVLWVGTGESNPGGDTFPGIGVFLSVDGGKSFAPAGLPDSARISRIVVDPRDSKHVYAAVVGDLVNTGPDRGVFETKDRGQTWNKILASATSPNDTGASDLVLNPANPNELFAGLWEVTRSGFNFQKGGAASGVFHSTDGGKTWVTVPGLPASDAQTGRIGLALFHDDPRTLYVTIDQANTQLRGLYRSDDSGQTFTALHGLDPFQKTPDTDSVYSSYGWWFGNVRVDPHNRDRVYVLGVSFFASTDGGKTFNSWVPNNWAPGQPLHPDHHALWINPDDPNHLLIGDDGGFWITADGGKSFFHAPLPITQFYSVTSDPSAPQHIYAGAQDNGTNRTLSGLPTDWANVCDGDGGQTRINPKDPKLIYCEMEAGTVMQSTDGGNTFTDPSVQIAPAAAQRAGWITPLLFDPTNPDVFYFGGESLYETDDRAKTWKAISPPLVPLPPGGNPVHYVISAMDVSPDDSKVIYIGYDSGQVYVTRDHGVTWTPITGQLPTLSVTSLHARPGNPGEVYITLAGLNFQQSGEHVYRSIDYGAHWTSIGSNLPEAAVNALVLDPNQRGTVYVASDVGVFGTDDLGKHWHMQGHGLPSMLPVFDLVIDAAGTQLTAATHGRGVWSLTLSPVPATPKSLK